MTNSSRLSGCSHKVSNLCQNSHTAPIIVRDDVCPRENNIVRVCSCFAWRDIITDRRGSPTRWRVTHAHTHTRLALCVRRTCFCHRAGDSAERTSQSTNRIGGGGRHTVVEKKEGESCCVAIPLLYVNRQVFFCCGFEGWTGRWWGGLSWWRRGACGCAAKVAKPDQYLYFGSRLDATQRSLSSFHKSSHCLSCSTGEEDKQTQHQTQQRRKAARRSWWEAFGGHGGGGSVHHSATIIAHWSRKKTRTSAAC